LFPSPLARHYITVSSLLISILLICCVVDVAFKVWTSKEIPDDVTRVPKPNLVGCGLPLQESSFFREGVIVLEVCILPLDATKLDGINLLMEVPMVDDGRRVAVGHERGSPQFKEPVNPSLRKFGVSKDELCEFKTSPR
jgi:hypothetical protein